MEQWRLWQLVGQEQAGCHCRALPAEQTYLEKNNADDVADHNSRRSNEESI